MKMSVLMGQKYQSYHLYEKYVRLMIVRGKILTKRIFNENC